MELSLTPLALIGIGLAAMFFGYGFGLFEGRGQGYKRRQKEEASDPTLRPVVPPPSPPAPPAAAPTPAPVAPRENALLKLKVDDQGQPCLDMDGQQINTSQMSPQQRKRLIDLMVMMRPWIESGPIVSAKPAAAPAPAPEPPPPGMAAAAQRATVPPFDSQPISRTTGPLNLGTGPLGAAEPPAPTPTTMVGQIDAILQTQLIGTPLASRGIRLVESTQGGAMVVVGLNRYAGVGDVPDPEVQAVIRAAIAEWEKKYTPG